TLRRLLLAPDGTPLHRRCDEPLVGGGHHRVRTSRKSCPCRPVDRPRHWHLARLLGRLDAHHGRSFLSPGPKAVTRVPTVPTAVPGQDPPRRWFSTTPSIAFCWLTRDTSMKPVWSQACVMQGVRGGCMTNSGRDGAPLECRLRQPGTPLEGA